MIYRFKCTGCDNEFEDTVRMNIEIVTCPRCGGYADKQFHATSDMFVPSYFHTNKSDIFSHEEWQALKKNPDIERAR